MQITAALAEAITPEQVFEAVVDQVGVAVDASSGGLWMLDEEQRAAHLLRSFGYSDEVRRSLSILSLAGSFSLPALDAIATGRPQWLSSQPELLARYPHLASSVDPRRSYRIACLPITVHGRVIGSLGFTFDVGPDFDEEQRSFLLLVARYSGQALERLRLLDGERANRARAEAVAARLALLSRFSRLAAAAASDASAAGGTPASPGSTGAAVLRLLGEQVTIDLADGCALSLWSRPAGTFQLTALHGRHGKMAGGFLAAFADAHPLFADQVARRVALTGDTFMAMASTGGADPAQELGRGNTTIPDIVAGWLHPGPHALSSVVVVALRSGGEILGTLAAFRDRNSPPFTDPDKHLLEEMAERTAIAVVSSRLAEDNEQARVRAELLYALAASVNDAQTVEDVFSLSLEAIQRALAAQRSAILVFDEGAVMRFRAWNGLSQTYRDAVEGHSPWTRDVRNPAPLFVKDVQNDPAWAAYSHVFRAEGIGALGFIPLVASGLLRGKFMVYYDHPRNVPPNEIDMATAIANHVAAAIARFSALDELKNTVRFNEMFTAILGHDLRNPLSAIMTAAQLLVKRGDGDKFLKPVARILNSGDRMARMIEQLLDFTRVRVGDGIPIEPVPVDLIPLLRQVVDELEDANPDWSLRLESSGDTVGTWDRDRLFQVFSNLVSNCVQHGIPAHGVRVLVDGTNASTVRIDVHNMGQIPPDLLPRLFEPLAGGEQGRTSSRGLGLGLFITQQIAKAHAGAIAVRSSASEGTTMTVTLPRVAPSTPAAATSAR